MAIRFFNDNVANPIIGKKQLLSCHFKQIISNEQHTTGDINYIFCSDARLLSINKQFLKHDYFTDVITFDYCKNSTISGDVFISTDRVRENAEKFNVDFAVELNRIMIHGLLHLLGYKDKSPSKKKIMTHMEDFYLIKHHLGSVNNNSL